MPAFTRRAFLQTAALAAPALASSATQTSSKFSFLLLGDLHLDKPEHHDMAWLEREKPGDIRQIQNYCRLTKELVPQLFATVHETIADLKRAGESPAFVLQVGDFVEGLCGSEALATKHHQHAIELVRNSNFGIPFLFTKGNHDVTGPGATQAFATIFHPFLSQQIKQLNATATELKTARFTVDHANAQFAFFDAYDKESLEWFEAVAAKRSAPHFFVIIHPPVVPYGARATWHLYSSAKDKPRREKLLTLMGAQDSLVLGGHIHKFSALTRTTGKGRFTQLAVSSIISAPEAKAKDLLTGVNAYNGDQIRVEPNYSPETDKERRAVYEAEREFVKSFDYADLPGYAVVHVDGPHVTADLFPGTSRTRWREIALTAKA